MFYRHRWIPAWPLMNSVDGGCSVRHLRCRTTRDGRCWPAPFLETDRELHGWPECGPVGSSAWTAPSAQAVHLDRLTGSEVPQGVHRQE